jgi:hypothetical protein
MKLLHNYRIYNNLVFLIPVILGIYAEELLFTILSILILLGSTLFHLSLVKEHKHTRKARILDICIAFSCYIYLLYFITYRNESSLQPLLYAALLLTLIVFMIGKQAKSDFIHAVFHTSIAVVAGIIVVL